MITVMAKSYLLLYWKNDYCKLQPVKNYLVNSSWCDVLLYHFSQVKDYASLQVLDFTGSIIHYSS